MCLHFARHSVRMMKGMSQELSTGCGDWLDSEKARGHWLVTPRLQAWGEWCRSRRLDGEKREGGRKKQPPENVMGMACGLYLESEVIFCPTCVFSAFHSLSLPFHLILLSVVTGKLWCWLFFPWKNLDRNLGVSLMMILSLSKGNKCVYGEEGKSVA